MNKLVSIIVPVYNAEKYLPKCIESILAQSYKNIEVILVDDGAKDKSGEICDEYAKRDQRIVVVHQKNGGQSNARNNGIKRAHGEYICFVDSDDEVKKNYVDSLMRAMENNNTSLAVCGMEYRKLQKHTVENVYIKKVRAQKKNESIQAYVLLLLILDGRMYSVINKIFDAEIIAKNKLQFPEKVNFAEDTRFVLDYAKVMDGNIEFVNQPLYVYNSGTETSTMKTVAGDWRNWKKSYDFLKKWVGEKPNAKERVLLGLVWSRWKISNLKRRG